MPLVEGLSATFKYVVRDDDTAVAVGSGDVPVLATPRVLALAERATCAAVHGHIPDDMTTVGTRAEVEHVVPTPVGGEVTVEAVLETVEGRKLRFGFRVLGAERPVAYGEVHRVLVTRERFLTAMSR